MPEIKEKPKGGQAEGQTKKRRVRPDRPDG